MAEMAMIGQTLRFEKKVLTHIKRPGLEECTHKDLKKHKNISIQIHEKHIFIG